MDEMEKDLAFLKEQLSQLEEPELPPTLTARALFARLDEGTLTLPEEEAAPEKEEQKQAPAVIPWGKIAKRWAPLAACLAIVLLLHQGYQVGLARNFTAQNAAPTAQEPRDTAQEPAAYSMDSVEGSSEEKAVLRSSAKDAPAETGGDDSLKAENGLISSAAPPAPEPALTPELAPEETKKEEVTGSAADGDSSSDSEDSESDSNPPTGGGGVEDGADPDPEPGWDMHPDTGGGDEPVNPDFGVGDSGEEGPSLYKQLKGQMEEIAAGNSPDESFISDLGTSFWPDDGQTLEFTARYWEDMGEKRVLRARRTFYCKIHQAEEGLWLELLYFEEKAVP